MKRNITNLGENEQMIIETFRILGYTVEPFNQSFIADNGTFCIPFTIASNRLPIVSAVSFSSADKEALKQKYSDCDFIGCELFSSWMNDTLEFKHVGRICNHDYDVYELKMLLS